MFHLYLSAGFWGSPFYSLGSNYPKSTVSESKEHTHGAKEHRFPSTIPMFVSWATMPAILDQPMSPNMLWKGFQWVVSVETQKTDIRTH